MKSIKQSQPAKNLQLIQMLRGFAALLVVFYHATVNCNQTLGNKFLFDFFDFGGTGVDIFFVLSGFIITYTSFNNLSQPAKLSKFVKRRAIRIFPTYWIFAAGLLALQLILPSFYNTKFSTDPVNLVKTFLLLPEHIMLNGVSWTLTYELYFYLIFALAFLIPSKRISFIMVQIYLLLLIILPFTGFNHKEHEWLGIAFYPMNIEFFMGITIVALIPRLKQSFAKPFLIFGITAFLINAVLTNSGYYLTTDEYNRVILFGVPAFFIITGVVKLELSRTINLHGLFLDLGEASYSLYLIHLPLLAAACKIIARFGIRNSAIMHIVILVLITLICYMSILFYRLIEKPIISRLNNWRRVKVANEI